MKTTNNFIGLVMAFLPVAFIGGLLLYLNNVRTAFFGLLDSQMGPTMMGLAAIGLLCLVLFLWKLRRFMAPPAPPLHRTGDRVEAALAETKSDFDADAAFERYMARRGTPLPGPGPGSGFPPPEGGGPRPGGFGRKGI